MRSLGSSEVCWRGGTQAPAPWSDMWVCWSFPVTSLFHAHQTHKTPRLHSKEPQSRSYPSSLPTCSSGRWWRALKQSKQLGLTQLFFLSKGKFFFPKKAIAWKRKREGGVGLKHQGRHQGPSGTGEKLSRRRGMMNTPTREAAGEQGWVLEMLGKLLKGWNKVKKCKQEGILGVQLGTW